MSEGITPGPADKVGIVGSDTTTGTLVVDLLAAAKVRSINGRMVIIAPRDVEGCEEYGLGTVVEIVNRNQYHENPTLRGVIALRGGLGALTAHGDVKTAKVDIQAAFRRRGQRLQPIGGTMTFAPDTGEQVYLVNTETIQSLVRQVSEDLFYVGTLYRQEAIPLPMSVPDFSGARGSSMAAFFGPSGSGKTYLATSFTACQMRHKRMAFLLIDPQGQFTTNSKVRRDLPLDLRALGEAQGREVRQLSVAQNVRMPKDEALFVDLLDNGHFFGATTLIAASGKKEDAKRLSEGWLRESAGKWHEHDSESLMDKMIVFLIENADSIMASDRARESFIDRLRQVLDDPEGGGAARRRALLRVFTGFHSMFTPTSATGTERVEITKIVKSLCDSHVAVGKSRPFYLLTLADHSADEGGGESMVSRAMKNTRTQMVILRTLFQAIEGEARWLYQSDDHDPANLMIVMDEAARYTSDSSRSSSEARQMAEDMARYFREIRKYAVGFTLILQEPSVMHESIWKQLRNGFRAFAGGMVGNDLDKVREQIGSSGPMNLYAQLAQPSESNQVYPWMVCGPVSPLNATNNPLFLEAFTSAAKWQRANAEWVPGIFNVSDMWSGRAG